MESKRNKRFLLLPVYFKKIGLALMVLAFVPAIVIKSMNVEIIQSQKELFRVCTSNAFFLGLLFVAWSKNKVEDEMTINIRLKAMAFAFIWTLLNIITSPFINLLFKHPVDNVTGQQIVIHMLFTYFLIYYLQKIGR